MRELIGIILFGTFSALLYWSGYSDGRAAGINQAAAAAITNRRQIDADKHRRNGQFKSKEELRK